MTSPVIPPKISNVDHSPQRYIRISQQASTQTALPADAPIATEMAAALYHDGPAPALPYNPPKVPKSHLSGPR